MLEDAYWYTKVAQIAYWYREVVQIAYWHRIVVQIAYWYKKVVQVASGFGFEFVCSLVEVCTCGLGWRLSLLVGKDGIDKYI